MKVSAQSDAWRPKKRRKTEAQIFQKFRIEISSFRGFVFTNLTLKFVNRNVGALDTLAVKVSAQSDAWRPKKRRKTETKVFEFFWIEISGFRYFGKVSEELQPNGPQNLLAGQISL